MSSTLVIGTSGTQRHAESLLARHPRVTALVTSAAPDPEGDPTGHRRAEADLARRPDSWQTVHTTDLTHALIMTRQPVLIDSLGDWVVGRLDSLDAWSEPERAIAEIEGTLDELVALWVGLPFDVVAVTSDSDLGMVPAEPAARTFREVLGHLNARVGAASSHVHLVTAGRVLDLSDAPRLS